MSEKEALKEKIVRLQNFHKIKDKKIKLMEDRIERQNKLIAKQKERTNRAIKYIKEYWYHYDKGDKECMLYSTNELLNILEGSDKE
jgi:predicted  nucleic acid-binding Zn-ribbon protein